MYLEVEQICKCRSATYTLPSRVHKHIISFLLFLFFSDKWDINLYFPVFREHREQIVAWTIVKTIYFPFITLKKTPKLKS